MDMCNKSDRFGKYSISHDGLVGVYIYIYIQCIVEKIRYFYFLKMAVTVWEVAVFHRRRKSMYSHLSSVFLTTCQVTTTLDLSSCCIEISKTVRKSLWWHVKYRKICIKSHQEGQAWFERHLHLHFCIISPPLASLLFLKMTALYLAEETNICQWFCSLKGPRRAET